MEAAQKIRVIAKTPIVDFFDDSSQRPHITVYLNGRTSTDQTRYIGRGFYHTQTMRFMGSFRSASDSELKNGNYGSPRAMSIEQFAEESEYRAKQIIN